MDITLWAWNICAGGQNSYTVQEGYLWTPRLQNIADAFKIISPDIGVFIDAFGWNKLDEAILSSLFPGYTISLYPLGEGEDMYYAYLEKTSTLLDTIVENSGIIYNRQSVSVRILDTSFEVVYLEPNETQKRQVELQSILVYSQADLLIGDFNTVFIDARETYFGGVRTFFQNWRMFGLWLCSSLIRGMHVNPRVLGDWIPLIQAPTFPLPYFWEGFLKGILRWTAWVWKNFLFPCPVIQVDHCLLNTRGILGRDQVKVTTLTGSIFEKASDHAPLLITITPNK